MGYPLKIRKIAGLSRPTLSRTCHIVISTVFDMSRLLDRSVTA
jgi:hypothetical protein